MKDFATIKADILNSDSASFWIKDAIRALDKRDPVDALHDLYILHKLFEHKLKSTTEASL